MQDWGDTLKVPLIGALGFSISGSTIDEWLRIGIALATLVYMSFKAATIVRDFYKNKNENKD
jgi:hypothetical protein